MRRCYNELPLSLSDITVLGEVLAYSQKLCHCGYVFICVLYVWLSVIVAMCLYKLLHSSLWICVQVWGFISVTVTSMSICISVCIPVIMTIFFYLSGCLLVIVVIISSWWLHSCQCDHFVQRRQSSLKCGGSWIRSQKFRIWAEKFSIFKTNYSIFRAQKFRWLVLVINSKNLKKYNINFVLFFIKKALSNILSVQNRYTNILRPFRRPAATPYDPFDPLPKIWGSRLTPMVDAYGCHDWRLWLCPSLCPYTTSHS